MSGRFTVDQNERRILAKCQELVDGGEAEVVMSPLGLAQVANGEHELARQSAEEFVHHALRCGEALIAAKETIAHGEWGKWLAKHFVASQDTANNYMRLAANSERVRNLNEPSVRKALQAIAAGSERRQEKKPVAPITAGATGDDEGAVDDRATTPGNPATEAKFAGSRTPHTHAAVKRQLAELRWAEIIQRLGDLDPEVFTEAERVEIAMVLRSSASRFDLPDLEPGKLFEAPAKMKRPEWA